MADFSSLISHPNYQEIVDKLVHGTTPKDVNSWLKLKYPNHEQKHLCLGTKILQDFIKSNYMDYSKQFAQDAAMVKSGNIDKLDRKIAESLLNNKTYRERLNEHADAELNPKKIMVGAIIMMQDRMEQVFDRIQEDPANFKPDYVLIQWCEKLFNAVEKYDKITNQTPDIIVQHNINNQQIVDQKLSIFQEALRETLSEIDAEASLLFLEKWTEKLNKLQPPAEQVPMSVEQKFKEAKMVEAKLLQEFVIPPDIKNEEQNE